VNPDGAALEAIFTRLETLEKRNRRSKLLLLCGIAAALTLGAQVNSGSQVIEGRAFVLRDDGGKERGRISTQGTDTSLVLNDDAQNPRAKLTVSKDGPALVLYGPGGKMLANLVAFSRPALTLNDQTEKIRVQVEVEDTGPFVTLYDLSGQTRVLLGVKEAGPLLKLYSEKGQVRFSAPQKQ
jgi:hypothetical protein